MTINRPNLLLAWTKKVRGWMPLCKLGARRYQTTGGESDPKQSCAVQLGRAGIAGNVVSPFRRLPQNIGAGKQPVREAHGGAGMGGWKKRTLACNGSDMDSNFVLP